MFVKVSVPMGFKLERECACGYTYIVDFNPHESLYSHRTLMASHARLVCFSYILDILLLRTLRILE